MKRKINSEELEEMKRLIKDPQFWNDFLGKEKIEFPVGLPGGIGYDRVRRVK